MSDPDDESRSPSERGTSETRRSGPTDGSSVSSAGARAPSAQRPDDDAVPEAFPPTLREVLLRPRWIGMLLLCLVVAGVFAWLGQWQLSRAVQVDPTPPGASEVVRPIGDVVQPGEYLNDPLIGQRVQASGTWVPSDFLIVQSRYNDGVEGYWVTGQLRLDDGQTEVDGPVSVAVALGWAGTEDAAHAAVERLEAEASDTEAIDVTGRLIADEGPVLPPHGADPQTMTRMSPAALLGRWHDVEELNVYRPYLASEDALGGLDAISSPAPEEGSTVNWLNIFYAVEWAVFAGFAFYLWYRLAKDAWEKEIEDLSDDEGDPEGDPEVGGDGPGGGDAARG